MLALGTLPCVSTGALEEVLDDHILEHREVLAEKPTLLGQVDAQWDNEAQQLGLFQLAAEGQGSHHVSAGKVGTYLVC